MMAQQQANSVLRDKYLEASRFTINDVYPSLLVLPYASYTRLTPQMHTEPRQRAGNIINHQM